MQKLLTHAQAYPSALPFATSPDTASYELFNRVVAAANFSTTPMIDLDEGCRFPLPLILTTPSSFSVPFHCEWGDWALSPEDTLARLHAFCFNKLLDAYENGGGPAGGPDGFEEKLSADLFEALSRAFHIAVSRVEHDYYEALALARGEADKW